MIGKILGDRYEIIEEIGKGGMAYVYKAKCILLNRIVAVKILRDDLDGGEEFLQRFNIEAQAAASLSHSNIVSIFDVGIDHGMHYIVMEYVDGITLKEYIVQKGRISHKEALDIAYQICDALQAAHEKNIVHRDIKPHNILVTEERNIKVTDFGIARSGTAKTLSTSDDILGSVHYISPEQAKGEDVDNRSDLYSLGIVLYEMLTGNVPFDADTPVAVAMMQIEQTAPEVNVPGIPMGVLQMMYKAICKSLSRRYQNAAEFKNDILCVIEDESFELPDGDLYFSDYNESFDDYYDQSDVNPFLKSLMIILAIITSVIIVGLGISMYNGNVDFLNFTNKVSVEEFVPSFVGMTLDEAQREANEKGYKIVVSDEISDSNFEAGCIVSQNPRENSKSDSAKVIKVVINKSTDSLLSDYVGISYKTAESDLEDLGCTVKLVFEESKKDEDTIIRQSPESGTKITDNMNVTLYVSSGIDKDEDFKTVPTLTGKTYSKCIQLLSSAGLTLGTVSGVDSPSNDDIVTYQTIPSGSMVKKGSSVSITLKSKKPKEQEVRTEEEPEDNATVSEPPEHVDVEGVNTEKESDKNNEDYSGNEEISQDEP